MFSVNLYDLYLWLNTFNKYESIISHLFMFFHSGIEFLGKVIGDIGHPWLLLIGSAHAALVFTRLLVVLLLCIFTVTFCVLNKTGEG